MSLVPSLRIRTAGLGPLRPERDFVLYWMIANRRLQYNFALDRALEQAAALGKPLVILEGLRCGYRWASARFHRFVLDGMAEHRRALEASPVAYHPYVESAKGAGAGLLEALARRACLVVTDDYPCFFLPRMVAAASERLDVALEIVDSNGLLPVAEPGRYFSRAYDLRRYLQKVLPEHLGDRPQADPLRGIDLPKARFPDEIASRWPAASHALLDGDSAALATLPIDHGVAPVSLRGGSSQAEKRLEQFLDDRLSRYGEDRNQPLEPATSGLSPYLHFGHISAHQVVGSLMDREGWTPERLATTAKGARRGWWGMSESAEGFLDQVVTWRELGFNACRYLPDYDRYHSLPEWARRTLAEHASDPRPELYSPEQLERAETDSDIWNAAQRELVHDGVMHNYLRMLWGKKILEWSESPEQALAVMIDLNNRYALDGRDPNSYSGIFWCLGRHDRAWGPERPIFGKIRFMSLESTRRKLKLQGYLEKHGPQPALF